MITDRMIYPLAICVGKCGSDKWHAVKGGMDEYTLVPEQIWIALILRS